MKEENSVHVLLPTYNGELFLKDQIKSILNQTYKNIKLLIRDDGSTDKTLEIIRHFQVEDPRVIVLENKEGNAGLVKSIEKLLQFSDADVIFFSDQDDYWLENKIQLFLENYTNPEIPTLIHSNCYVTDDKLNVQYQFLNGVSHKKGLEDSLFHYFVQGASVMINSRLKEMLLPFPNDVYIHDRYFHIVSEIVGQRIYIDSSTMYYRQHGGNLIGSQSIFSKIKKNFKLKKFYIYEDKIFLQGISKRFSNNELLKIYNILTSDTVSRIKKIKLLKQYNISLRLKEKILLLIKN